MRVITGFDSGQTGQVPTGDQSTAIHSPANTTAPADGMKLMSCCPVSSTMRWSLLLVGLIILSAGCLGVGTDGDSQSRLDLTVQNDGTQPVSFQLTVTDADETILVNESERLDSNVGRSFDFTVGTTGRHEVTVAGEDWTGQVAWNADSCARYDATIRVSDDSVEVAGECLEQQ